MLAVLHLDSVLRSASLIGPIAALRDQSLKTHVARAAEKISRSHREAENRFFCIECSVQVVVGSEAQVQSAAVRFQREQRLCTRCMSKRETGTKRTMRRPRPPRTFTVPQNPSLWKMFCIQGDVSCACLLTNQNPTLGMIPTAGRHG